MAKSGNAKIVKSRGFKRLERELQKFDMRKADGWRPVYNTFATAVNKNFAQEKRRDTGEKWAPLKSNYASSKHAKFTLKGKRSKRTRSEKAKRHKILQLTQTLRKAASNPKNPRFIIQETPRKLILALAGIPYAARHNFGYPGGKGRGRAPTPARPFWVTKDGQPVIAKSDVDEIKDTIESTVLLYFRRLLRR